MYQQFASAAEAPGPPGNRIQPGFNVLSLGVGSHQIASGNGLPM